MRPTFIEIDRKALVHNVQQVRLLCPSKHVYAMVKANAYGCGIEAVVPILDPHVDAFGVACLEEATRLREYSKRPCILFQGVFTQAELLQVSLLNLDCVIHHQEQLRWLLATPLERVLRVWVKVNTGMNRLGFEIDEVSAVIKALSACPWVDKKIGLMSHMACADEVSNPTNLVQLDTFQSISLSDKLPRSLANSAAIITMPDTHFDVVRPGLMLYGASPIKDKTATELNLKPVMNFISTLTVIHDFPAGRSIGYSGTWKTTRPTRIGVVAVGYGDGYPRHIAVGTPVWLNGKRLPIVGRVSMDMLTIDLTDAPEASLGDRVELWGQHLPVEEIAQCAGTIAYELLTQVSSRVREKIHLT